MFTVSKIAGFFSSASNVLIVAGLLGILLLLVRRERAGRALLTLGVIGLAIAGFSPLGNALMLPLEQRFPPWDATRGAPDGIIVLGGEISPEVSAARNTVALTEAAERLTVAVALARSYPAAKIVFSGGNGDLFGSDLSEAQFAGRLLENLGVAHQRITLEARSRTTAENATMSKALVNPQPGARWLLVTSAHHMPRSIGAFRRAGFAVEAYPVDWRTRSPADLNRPFRTLSAGLARTDAALHEWVGLAGYWLTGRTSEFLPSP
jgi:uncharacterized SAM-binding protein YcdF (DUF218 family)